MSLPRSAWINVLAGIVGGVALGVGLVGLFRGVLGGAVWAVLGFLVVGWAVLDRRRARPDTPESELHGGRTIE